MSTYIKHNDQYYILSGSSLADDRTMTLKCGDTFAVFDRFGDIHPIGSGVQGIFYDGMRFISCSEMLIENRRALFLSSSLKEENELLTVDMTNPDFGQKDKNFTEKGIIHIHRTKFLWEDACYENIELANFGTKDVAFDLSLLFEADFSDIFEVRGIKRMKKGCFLQGKASGNQILIGYKGLDDIIRKTRITFCDDPVRVSTCKADFAIQLKAQEVYNLSFSIEFEAGDRKICSKTYAEAYEELTSYLKRTKEEDCELYTSHDLFNNWLARARSDLYTMVTKTEHGLYPYAGVPWYSCPFGRDGIITAMQTLWMDPEISKGVLKFCAHFQATTENDFQDAEPGKIFHEKRGGEMANLGEVPFKIYYGTIDATPLFVVLAGMYFERTHDVELMKELWPNIEAALGWMDKYGDPDGDGFLEYRKKSEKGLANQGWKDSSDSIMYEDGTLAEGPIALCEVQGYAYDARLKAAEIADALGKHEKAKALRQQAAELKKKFLDKFWDEELGTFVIAIDGEKKPCRVQASNAGHALFSGIADKEHAKKMVPNLMSENMFSGWGIRTLGGSEVRYNPMSYHNGSVWPHDTAIIAYGMAQYGYDQEVHKLLKGLFEMSAYMEHQRLPELLCGFKKRKKEGPTAYPVACSPQSWAIGTVYMLLQACLGIKIVAKENAIYFFKPSLPDFLDELTITNLRVKDAVVVLQIRREVHGEVSVQVLHKDGNMKIEIIKEYLCRDKLPEVLERSLKIDCSI